MNPDIIVFDLKRERKPVDAKTKNIFSKFKAKKIKVNNPPSNITEDLWDAVKMSLKEKSKVKIFVEGEEDLTVFPFVMESPIDTIILYGLGNSGVMIKVSKKLKQKCGNIMKMLEDYSKSQAETGKLYKKLEDVLEKHNY